ncbi:MAG: hypothetical protein WCA48_13660, partial [Pseudomonas gingeri]
MKNALLLVDQDQRRVYLDIPVHAFSLPIYRSKFEISPPAVLRAFLLLTNVAPLLTLPPAGALPWPRQPFPSLSSNVALPPPWRACSA